MWARPLSSSCHLSVVQFLTNRIPGLSTLTRLKLFLDANMLRNDRSPDNAMRISRNSKMGMYWSGTMGDRRLTG